MELIILSRKSYEQHTANDIYCTVCVMGYPKRCACGGLLHGDMVYDPSIEDARVERMCSCNCENPVDILFYRQTQAEFDEQSRIGKECLSKELTNRDNKVDVTTLSGRYVPQQ